MLCSGAIFPFSKMDMDMDIGNTRIEVVDDFKYLGIYHDEHLTLNTHIDKIAKKVRQRVCVVYKMYDFIPSSLAKYI